MRRGAGLKVSEVNGIAVPHPSTKGEAIAERKRIALAHLAQGKNTSQIARDAMLARDTLYDWRSTDPVFAAEWERIAAEAAKRRDEALADEMEDIMIGMARGVDEVVDADGEKKQRFFTKEGFPSFSAVKHMAATTNPKRHGDKKQVEHTGTVVHTLIPQARRLDVLLAGEDVIDVESEEAE